MLHTKSQGHRPPGSGEEDFKRVFTIYGHGGHLGHVTRTFWTNFRSPILRSLHMKFEFNWPSGFRGEDVWKWWRTDNGRQSHWYTNSSPRSLRLRWAKKISLNGQLSLNKIKTSITPSTSSPYSYLGVWVVLYIEVWFWWGVIPLLPYLFLHRNPLWFQIIVDQNLI